MVSAARRLEPTAEHSDGERTALETLVAQARDGDVRAYEVIYRRTTGRVYAVCLRMVGDRQEAEELTQDVFVRAWEKLDSFRGDSRFTTWLHRLTVNLVLQHRRTRGRRWAREQGTADPAQFGTHAPPETPGKRIDLERAIRALPPKAQEVLILRDIEGFKYREVADMTGTAVGTVKAQVHRARKLVQEALER